MRYKTDRERNDTQADLV